ncbi:hypothetical protein B7463_g3877, partial [Scytalidium lignicola]
MAFKKHEYTSLDKVSNAIRLITILPGSFNDEICCQCFHTKIEDAPDYECLSYAWGKLEFSSSILINNHTLPITSNLEVALRHLRHPSEKRVMWIDAICINQADNEERSSQVGFMSQIYSHAKLVVVWIGPQDETSDRAINFLKKMGRERAVMLSHNYRDGVRQHSSVGSEFGDEEDEMSNTESCSAGDDTLNESHEIEDAVLDDENNTHTINHQYSDSDVGERDPLLSGPNQSGLTQIMSETTLGSISAQGTSAKMTLKQRVLAWRQKLIYWWWHVKYKWQVWRRRWDPLLRHSLRRQMMERRREWDYSDANIGHIIFGMPVLYENSYDRFFHNDRYLGDWLAVDKLFVRPWFSRTWVVQEVWKSSNTMLQCGHMTLAWKIFELSMSYSEAWDDMGTSIQGTAREKDWVSLKRRYSLATHISNKRLLGSNLNSLLWNTWDRESSDPLDKVFAILGLVGEQSKGMIQPDYSKTMGAVYRETAREIIRSQKNLDILLGACGPTRQDGLPSWVPDWRHSANQNRPTLFVNRKRLLTMYYSGSMEAAILHGHGYKAAGNMPAGFNFDSKLDILEVSALFLSTIAKVDVIHPMEASAEDILSSTYSFVISSKRTWLPRFKLNLKKELKALLVAGLVDKNADEVLRNVMMYRRFFITKGGDMCIGPAATVPGDQVFIIAGCNFPMVLRKEGQSYVLVGDASWKDVWGGTAKELGLFLEEACLAEYQDSMKEKCFYHAQESMSNTPEYFFLEIWPK